MQVLIYDLRARIRASGFFGLSFDDSKAVDNVEFMSLEVYYVDTVTGKPRNDFVKLHPVNVCDAETLAEDVVGHLRLSDLSGYKILLP